jgi:hypothetical protein
LEREVPFFGTRHFILQGRELSKPQVIDVVVAVHPSGISGARNVSDEIEPFA